MLDLSKENILCLDFEASSLKPGSYPIEVGITDVATGATRSWLIRPIEQWITNGVSAGTQVLADAPQYDGIWLATLYAGAGIAASPFSLGNFYTFADLLTFRTGRRFDIAITNSELEAQIRSPHIH